MFRKFCLLSLVFLLSAPLAFSKKSSQELDFINLVKNEFKEDYSIYQKQIKRISKAKNFNREGLTEAEQIAIYGYTLSFYSNVNPALRAGGDRAKKVAPYTKVMNRALKKIKNYRGIVVRGTNLPARVLANYKVGNIVSDPAYTSTSALNRHAGPHKINIKSKTGKGIVMYSAVPEDMEVLFLPNTKFKVLNVVEGKNGKTIFDLEEI